MNRDRERSSIVFYGYCQAGALCRLVQQIPSLVERFEVCAVDLSDSAAKPALETLERCTHFFYQLTPIDILPLYVRPLLAKAHVIRFPAFYCEPIWPQHIAGSYDPRVPDQRCGPYPYGDRVLLDLLSTGLADSEIVERYLAMDLTSMFDLAGLTTAWANLLQKLDERSDILVADYVWSEWRKRRLFWTVNHPSNGLLGFVLRQVLARAFGRTVSDGEIAAALLRQELNLQMQPVHPSVASALGLRWISEDSKFNHWPHGPLSLREWAYRYVDHMRSLTQLLASRMCVAQAPGSRDSTESQNSAVSTDISP